MRSKPALLIVLLSALTLSACMKQVINPDGSINTKTDGNVSSTPLSNADSYQPITKGSTWNYTEDLAGQTITATYVMNGAKTTFNGKTYYNVDLTSSLTAAGGTGYYLSSVHQYNMRSTSMQAGITVDLPFLIDTVAIGHTWTGKINESGLINGIPGRFVGTMTERNISKTVNGKLYNNVMHTQVDLQYLVQGNYESFTLYDFYVAKGVGVIELDAGAFGMAISTMVLTSYSIK